ncbi:hypothetical protein LF817_05510 [Halobacillus sp. A1]|uniref:hypothetical protein n=1 Tax=Halobacillus sp. A1 TaxID=2880262 RepID=UPI0020A63D53|nr:hypothetical protein [Halobacillus sp. A1]MCP3030794.1 hypothetical protein [Halobacillus sp. A1]
MSAKYIRYSFITGNIAFGLCLILLLLIEAPSPYLGSLIVAFLIFEISFYHLFDKEKQKSKWL